MKYLVPICLVLLPGCVSPKPAPADAVMSTPSDPLAPPEKPVRHPAYPSARHLSSWPHHSPFCCITMGMHCNCILPITGDEPLYDTEVDPLD